MTTDPAGVRAGTTLSLPEELQLALPPFSGQLRQGSMDIAVAAIIELALMGRVVGAPSWTGMAWDAKLTVADASPTGSGPLDVVVRELVAHGKPWKARSFVSQMWAVVSEATTASLVSRGAVSAHGTMRDSDGHLVPLDLDLRAEYVARLERAPSPDDPRATVLMDIRHHSSWGWTAQPGQSKPPILGDYPANVDVVARGALTSLYVATG